MKLLHEIAKRVYQKVLAPVIRLEVLSDTGWQDVRSLNVTGQEETVELRMADRSLRCSPKHILIAQDGSEIYAGDSLNKLIKTDDGVRKVLSVAPAGIHRLYDLSLSGKSTHLYFTNGVLSHNCVIIDEMAFIPKNVIDEFFASVMPVVSSAKDSKVIAVSTPNGTSGLYYEVWQQSNSKDAKKNKEGWKPFRIDWFEVPGRDQQWKEKQIASIGERRFAQEFGNEFLSGNGSKKLIPDDIIERYRMKLAEYKAGGVRPKECKILSETEDKVFKFDVWHPFDESRTYCATADTAEGVGGDDSVLYIWDVTDLRNVTMCLQFASNTVSIIEFAFICSKILPLYGDPPLFGERNGVSAGMLDSLRITYGYQNIPVENKNNDPGIYSHVTVKTKSCLWAREMTTTDGFGFTIYDKELVDEMGTFVKKDNKSVQTVFAAASGAHDDRIMNLVWLCYALSPERVDRYFVVCQNFTTALGQVWPRYLAPLNQYDLTKLAKISKDPVYNDFMEFKREMNEHVNAVQTAFESEDRGDVYFRQPAEDQYFGDTGDGPSWNDGRRGGAEPLNANNHFPVFFT